MVTEKSCNLSQNELTTYKNKEMEPVAPVWMSIYQSNTYRKDFSWLHLDDELRV